MLLSLLSLACWSPEQLCNGRGPNTLELGHGSGTVFEPFVEGEEVEIITPPQGGFGVTFRARSVGLRANDFVDLDMATTVGDTIIGEFSYPDMLVYCQDDGAGLMWGTATPIDHPDYQEIEDLQSLEGQEALLTVTATDQRGQSATAESWVTLVLSPQAGL